MNPTLEQLARYIAQELDRGIPESTLRSALLQRGWTMDWVDAAVRLSRQQAAPVQVQPVAPQVSIAAQPQAALSRPAAPTAQIPPLTQPQNPNLPSDNREVLEAPRTNRTRSFIILGVIFGALVAIGVGAYLVVTSLNRAEQARLLRDGHRKEDLSLILNKLSDYYVAHGAYPTRDQLNDTQFLRTSGLNVEAIKDPQWSMADTTCTKNGKAVLASAPAQHCYAYEPSTSAGVPCDAKTPCTRMKVTILLEKDKNPNVVIFDQNSEVGQ